MDDNCGEWVECMGVASGCGWQEVGVASGWNLWVWLECIGVVSGCCKEAYRYPHNNYYFSLYIRFLFALFWAVASQLLCSFFNFFPFFNNYLTTVNTEHYDRVPRLRLLGRGVFSIPVSRERFILWQLPCTGPRQN